MFIVIHICVYVYEKNALDFMERNVAFTALLVFMDVNVKCPATVLREKPVISLLAVDQTPCVVSLKYTFKRLIISHPMN